MVHLQELKHMLRLDIFILLHTCSSSWVCNKHNPQCRLNLEHFCSKNSTHMYKCTIHCKLRHSTFQREHFWTNDRLLNHNANEKFKLNGPNRVLLYASSLQWCDDLLQVIEKKEPIKMVAASIPLKVLLYGRMKNMIWYEMMVCQR